MKKQGREQVYMTFILLGLAIASCAFGVCRGEADTVLQKAVTICLECIGIG